MKAIEIQANNLYAVSKKYNSRKNRLTEEELILALKKMDRAAMNDLYKMYSDSLYRIISTLIQIEEVAQDILQETFIKIWKTFSQYDPSKGKLYTWMARLAKNLSIDYLRSSNHRRCVANEDLSILTQQIDEKFQISYNPETIGVKDMIRVLDEDQKVALDLIYFKGYTQVQAAEELNISVGILRSRLQSSISILRKIFTKDQSFNPAFLIN
jgi:RNA polymerase sigma-70 factor (ECF subfamily)